MDRYCELLPPTVAMDPECDQSACFSSRSSESRWQPVAAVAVAMALAAPVEGGGAPRRYSSSGGSHSDAVNWEGE